MKVNEEFLHYVWRYTLFNHFDLCDLEGQEIVIIKKGNYNTNAGPDFLEAQIRIGSELWFGSVEFHMKPSDWYLHKHQFDERYSNVILHVVYSIEKDEKVVSELNIPTLSLKGRIPIKHLEKYEQFRFEQDMLPCKSHMVNFDVEWLKIYYESLLVDRFEGKLKFVEDIYHSCNQNLEETIYRVIARSWGMKVNREAFSVFAEQTPLKIIRKYREDIDQMEALLFGQSGLLPISPVPSDNVDYWRREYAYLRTLHTLNPIAKRCWYFFQLRPKAFPTIRISLWANLLYRVYDFEKELLVVSLKECFRFLKTIEVSDFWQSHYVFDIDSKKSPKRLGVAGALNIIINAIVPLRMFLARRRSVELNGWDNLLDELSAFSPENNTVLRSMVYNGFVNENAVHSQALLQLNQKYCISKKCLNCRVGNKIMRNR